MIELRDLPTEGGRESVPVSRTLLNLPVPYARQNPEISFPALALDCDSGKEAAQPQPPATS